MNIEPHYTQGPWYVGAHPRDDSGTAWREILHDSAFGPAYVCQAVLPDAHRIVACVNALQGVTTAQIEAEARRRDGGNLVVDVMHRNSVIVELRSALQEAARKLQSAASGIDEDHPMHKAMCKASEAAARAASGRAP